MSKVNKKLWGGRFEKELDQDAKLLSYSFDIDKWLYAQDIEVNLVHVKALLKAKILSKSEYEKLTKSLKGLGKKFETELLFKVSQDEDIHSAIERLVIEEIGDLGKKLHTGKSRNDQVATDVRLYLKETVRNIINLLGYLQKVLWEFANNNKDLIFPGFTHMQPAQPVLFAHHILAYYEKLGRDLKRLQGTLLRIDESPLGSAALGGSNYPLDRKMMAKDLGFSAVMKNSMDAVSARDFILEYFANAAIAMNHLSQFADELILWSSPVFGFIEIGDEFTTGSSIMPQKKNPDIAELIRGRTGSMLGDFVALHELIKGLPLTYNRDLQWDKQSLFENVRVFTLVLICMIKMVPTIKINKHAIDAVLAKGYILATELADYLVLKGMSFRKAHEITGKIVQYAHKKGCGLEKLSLDEFKKFSSKIEKDINETLNLETAVAKKAVYGGTAPKQVAAQLSKIKEDRGW